jgi:hypothetical protein
VANKDRRAWHERVRTLRWNVPSSAATTTTLPAFAAISQNSSSSGKNWPSSMPITSKSRHCSPISESDEHDVALNMLRLCVHTAS